MLQLLAQGTYDYTYGNLETTSDAGSIPPVVIVLYIVLVAIMLTSMWKLFTKAGKPGWAALVPLYNSWVMIQIAGKPTWWFLLLFIPLVNLVTIIMLYIEISKKFGKSGGFAAVLILFPYVGFPMLAFGKAQYNGGQATDAPIAPVASPFAVPAQSTTDETPQVPQAPTPPAAPTPPTVPPAAPPSQPPAQPPLV